jgi:hypothetical protein
MTDETGSRALFGDTIAAEVRNRAASVIVSYCVPRAKSSRRAEMLRLRRYRLSNVGIRGNDCQSLNATPRRAGLRRLARDD